MSKFTEIVPESGGNPTDQTVNVEAFTYPSSPSNLTQFTGGTLKNALANIRTAISVVDAKSADTMLIDPQVTKYLVDANSPAVTGANTPIAPMSIEDSILQLGKNDKPRYEPFYPYVACDASGSAVSFNEDVYTPILSDAYFRYINQNNAGINPGSIKVDQTAIDNYLGGANTPYLEVLTPKNHSGLIIVEKLDFFDPYDRNYVKITARFVIGACGQSINVPTTDSGYYSRVIVRGLPARYKILDTTALSPFGRWLPLDSSAFCAGDAKSVYMEQYMKSSFRPFPVFDRVYKMYSSSSGNFVSFKQNVSSLKFGPGSPLTSMYRANASSGSDHYEYTTGTSGGVNGVYCSGYALVGDNTIASTTFLRAGGHLVPATATPTINCVQVLKSGLDQDIYPIVYHSKTLNEPVIGFNIIGSFGGAAGAVVCGKVCATNHTSGVLPYAEDTRLGGYVEVQYYAIDTQNGQS